MRRSIRTRRISRYSSLERQPGAIVKARHIKNSMLKQSLMHCHKEHRYCLMLLPFRFGSLVFVLNFSSLQLVLVIKRGSGRERRCSNLESRTKRLTDSGNFMSEVHFQNTTTLICLVLSSTAPQPWGMQLPSQLGLPET